MSHHTPQLSPHDLARGHYDHAVSYAARAGDELNGGDASRALAAAQVSHAFAALAGLAAMGLGGDDPCPP